MIDVVKLLGARICVSLTLFTLKPTPGYCTETSYNIWTFQDKTRAGSTKLEMAFLPE